MNSQHDKGSLFLMKTLLTLVVWNSLLLGAIQKQSFSYLQEELVNALTFTHELLIDNMTKKERYAIDGKEVTSTEFEERLSQAEKEERKKKRQRQQEERLKLHEARYRGSVKISQKDLALVLLELDTELNRLMDERLKPFLVFPAPALASEKELMELKEEHLPKAKALQNHSSDLLDITLLTTTLTSMKKAVTAVKETFIETVSNALEKADDTRLLKDLLTLL